MTDAVKRKLRILDIMILVGVTAIALAAGRLIWSRGRYVLSLLELPPAPFGWGALAIIVSGLVILIAMLALIPLGLRHPRPALNRLWRQPGWLACNAVALAMMFTFSKYITMMFIILIARHRGLIWDRLYSIYLRSFMFELPDRAVLAIAAAWTTLALVGAWEPDKGWIDRWGTRLAICLMFYPVLGWITRIV
jgi:hypothetical protein